jgi:hypothetical protein
VIKLLDGIWEMAVQLSVHTVYLYIYIWWLLLCVMGKTKSFVVDDTRSSYALYLTFLLN